MTSKVGREAWELISELIFNGSMHDRFQRASASIGVAPGVMKGLIHLQADLPLPMRDLADHFGCDASYVTTIVDGLEERGLAERRPHATDRRIKTVVLTARGLAAKQQALDLLYEPPKALDALTAAEQRLLRDLVRKITVADGSERDLDRVRSGVATRG